MAEDGIANKPTNVAHGGGKGEVMPPSPQGAHRAAKEAAQVQEETRSTEEHQYRRKGGWGLKWVASRRTAWRKKEIQEGFLRLCKQYKQKHREGVEIWGDGERQGTAREGPATQKTLDRFSTEGSEASWRGRRERGVG